MTLVVIVQLFLCLEGTLSFRIYLSHSQTDFLRPHTQDSRSHLNLSVWLGFETGSHYVALAILEHYVDQA